MKMKLTEEDEFLIMGCDGIWDVFRSQNAVDFARRKLQEHNDPEACCQDLVCEALKRKSCDNLAVIVICFSSRLLQLWRRRSRFQRSISAEGLKGCRASWTVFEFSAMKRHHGIILLAWLLLLFLSQG
ncbi:hypothetical protein HPP92_023326 [Vanilla planifolia]|uniref:protein-serine/threonine phosphatase n=1 Tax=Vanilla planifolia TaxID=51239 RepID=A0A835UCR0_VANPL|nr:hypothetical protein HPP92_023326 [Vanilla planifolia]